MITKELILTRIEELELTNLITLINRNYCGATVKEEEGKLVISRTFYTKDEDTFFYPTRNVMIIEAQKYIKITKFIEGGYTLTRDLYNKIDEALIELNEWTDTEQSI